MPPALPRIVCEPGAFAELTADPAAQIWRDRAPIELLETISGSVPLQRTLVRIGSTADEFRVLFEAHDIEPWATLTARDAPLYTEEVCEVFIDPVGDLKCYFEIEVNPLNAVMDLVVRRNRSGWKKDFAWQCEDLRSEVRRTPHGWCAELAIPFRSLTAEPPQPGATWRANFYRIDRPRDRERELSAWSPTLRPNFHTPERFGVVEFR